MINRQRERDEAEAKLTADGVRSDSCSVLGASRFDEFENVSCFRVDDDYSDGAGGHVSQMQPCKKKEGKC